MKFFFIMLAVVLGTNFYIFFRLWHLIPAGSFLRPFIIIAGIVVTPSIFVGILFGSALPTVVAAAFYKFGTSWFIISVYVAMAFLLLDLLRFTPLPIKKILHENWITFGVLAVTITAIMTYGYFNYKNKERVELAITIKAKNFSPLRMVALSDLHLGYTIGKSELEEWVELINRENPDLVLMAGDVIDNHQRPLIEQDLVSVLRKIKSRYGVYACFGNHEYIGSRGEKSFAPTSDGMKQTLDFFKNANITILRDTAVLINNEFYVVGREDFRIKNRKKLPDLLQNMDRTKPIILLDHQPFNLQETAENFVDLQISGHTHNGQVFPANLLVKCIYEMVHGHLQKDQSHIYVSSGIGIWGGKFRIGTQSEYVVIELKN
jgi:predicted MPP superfamily phosphohydrolase